MEVVKFSDLKLDKENTFGEVKIAGKTITVKYYLPMEEKIAFVSSVLNNSADDNNFLNPMKLDVCFAYELISRYTNIVFTEEDKEDLTKLYDLLLLNGIYSAICARIPESEFKTIKEYTLTTVEEFYKQQNSAMGIMEKVTSDYSNLDFEANDIREKLQSGDFNFLKEVLDKMG